MDGMIRKWEKIWEIEKEPCLIKVGLLSIREEFVPWAYEHISVERKQKADKCIPKNAREQSILAGWLLEEMLRQEGWEPPFFYRYSDRGKPKLPNIQFSLSHCKEYCGVILGPVKVGIDVEMRGRYHENITERFFTEAEQRYLKCPDADLLFTILWTCKESAAKCLDESLETVCRLCDMSSVFDAIGQEKNAKDLSWEAALEYKTADECGRLHFAITILADAVMSYCIWCPEKK